MGSAFSNEDKTIIIDKSYIASVIISLVLSSILFSKLAGSLRISTYDALLIIWPTLLFDLVRNIGKAIILPIDVIIRFLRPLPRSFKPKLISIIIPAKKRKKR